MITKTTVVSRQPDDSHVFELSVDLAESIPYDCEFYYIWSDYTNGKSTIEQLNDVEFKTKIVVCAVVDTFLGPHEHSWWKWKTTYGMHAMNQLCKNNPNHTFILMCELFNLELEIDSPNLHIVYLGDQSTRDINNRISKQKYNPLKNLHPEKNWLMLNNNAQTHRMLALSYIIGNDLFKYGNITVSNTIKDRVNGFKGFNDMMYWDLNAPDDMLQKLESGFTKLKTWEVTKNELNSTHTGHSIDITSNFNNFLFKKYKDCFIEIISESTFNEMPVAVTEKTLNAVYGFNFPIFISNPGTVKYLEELGFDMFRDVINHDYDMILNPAERFFAIFEYNKELLTSHKSMYSTWHSCKDRFMSNLELAQTDLVKIHRARAFNQLQSITNLFNTSGE